MNNFTNQGDYKACVLLGVWGENFIKHFLELSLPSLLAPGNLPALAKKFPTRFVFLTRSFDKDVFEQHSAFQKLQSLCDISFIAIEDLIVLANYSTTLTLAYDRAIKEAGDEMLRTYFFFLTSDYVMADGSCEGIIKYIDKGYSGICAGNFQVVEEEIKPFLLKQINPDTKVLQLSPRELLKKSLQHLHPIAVASTGNQKVIHNYHANRFFWRLDQQVLAGRFYLLHMLCIKPETKDYQIGSSCDYSFIPEMCPSGNVAIINDSDDYLVVEVQPKGHELNFISWGAYDYKKLAQALAEWTTVQHRENAKHTIYFHAREIPDSEKKQLDYQLDNLVDGITKHLQHYPIQSFRDHPYWTGAVKAFNEQRTLIKEINDSNYFDVTPLLCSTTPRKIYYRAFGVPPQVFPWHYRWCEYQQVKKTLQKFKNKGGYKNIVALYDSFEIDQTKYNKWFKDSLDIHHHYHIKTLKSSPSKVQALKNSEFDLCILSICVDNLQNISESLMLAREILKRNGKILVFISNSRNQYSWLIYNFKGEFAHRINAFIGTPYRIVEVQSIHNNLTMIVSSIIDRVNKLFVYNKKRKFLAYILCGIPGICFVFFVNLFSQFFTPKHGHCTNLLVTLEPDEEIEI